MKRNFKIFLVLGIIPFLLTDCTKEYDPSDMITPEKLIQMPDGLTYIANGNYSMFKDVLFFNGVQNGNYSYLRQYFYLSDFSGDDVVCGQVTTDPLFLSFNLNHAPAQENTSYFWYVSYKMISATNLVISLYERGELSDPSAKNLQLVGENYFIRAFAHFSMLNLFAKPYTHDPNGPGIVIRNSDNEPAQKPRATVKEVYEFILDDLRIASGLMQPNTIRGKGYASVYAAYALMSRAFLYMEEPDSVIKYSDLVINSGRYSITDDYPNYFRAAPSSDETIWCIIFTEVDDLKKFGSIGSMYYSDGNSGWGEEYASDLYRDLLAENPGDNRSQYVVPLLDDQGNIMTKTGTGIRMYYITKFSFQDGSPTLSSPVMFRISEMYLNRAEAYARKGDDAGALNDLDAIRQNRNMANNLFNGTVPAGKTALQTVLDERRLELAFEGHRTFDVYRNKMDLNRTYWGYHLTGLKESDVNYDQPAPVNIISWNDPRIIYYIPENEIRINTLCTQNP
ncbi:MAG: RagB/SusD family nutrient uptake outer membrane protein [Bacteroidales bacterium]|nr:RagB/SusD family nutrient uptake outer membrane protein [Bacteroidales bacterium]